MDRRSLLLDGVEIATSDVDRRFILRERARRQEGSEVLERPDLHRGSAGDLADAHEPLRVLRRLGTCDVVSVVIEVVEIALVDDELADRVLEDGRGRPTVLRDAI